MICGQLINSEIGIGINAMSPAALSASSTIVRAGSLVLRIKASAAASEWTAGANRDNAIFRLHNITISGDD